MYSYWANNKLFESSIYDTNYSNADLVEKLGEVEVFDEKTKSYKTMKPSDLIKVCADALYKMERDYPYLYQFLAKCKVMYIPTFPSKITDTMAVDENGNLWINFTFVYNECKMSSDRIFGIFFHELFHIFLDHLFRFEQKYPKKAYEVGGADAYRTLNKKANLCMDYEVNSSMVEDGIVSQDFWKNMNGLYKKEYAGMTWEEIMDKFGDQEYREWMERNGQVLNETELKVLDAIEKASKTLLNPDAEEDEKRAARKQLQKELDDILGKRDRGEKTLQDMFEDLENSKLGDISDLSRELDEVYDDLHRDPAGMSGEELDKTLRDMEKVIDDIDENAEEIGSQFGKSTEDVQEDAEKAKKAFNDAMKQINEGGLSRDEKQDLIDKAKDALEDIISDEVEKEKNKKKREERDAKKAAERLEKFKKYHPLRSIIIVMKNFGELIKADLVSPETVELTEKINGELEPLTEKKFGDMKKSELKALSDYMDELKESLYKDLVELINNETILNKTEGDMRHLIDTVFEHVYNAFRRIFDKTIDDDAKGSLIRMAASKLRVIGKILKTQKVWRVTDEYKKGYKEETERLMDIMKKEGEEGLFKALWDMHAIDPSQLDEHGLELLKKVAGVGSIDDIEDYYEDSDEDYGDDEDYDEGEIEPYEGTVYYQIYNSEAIGSTIIELSDAEDYLSDDWDVYAPLKKKFEDDFPEYILEEEMESVFSVYIKSEYNKSKYVSPSVKELKTDVSKNSDYKEGVWKEDE